jgi:hypothetical protein
MAKEKNKYSVRDIARALGKAGINVVAQYSGCVSGTDNLVLRVEPGRILLKDARELVVYFHPKREQKENEKE